MRVGRELRGEAKSRPRQEWRRVAVLWEDCGSKRRQCAEVNEEAWTRLAHVRD